MRTASQLVVTFLLNAAWQVALVTAVALVADWLLRSAPARFRHTLWIAALFMSIGLPAITISSGLGIKTTANQLQPTIEPARVISSEDHPSRAEPNAPFESNKSASSDAVASTQRQLSPIRVNRKVAAVLTVVFAGLFIFGCGRLLRAWFRTRRLVATACRFELAERLQEIISVCSRLIPTRPVQFYSSSSIALPITVGSFHPLIILPESLLRETDDEVLISAIGHELVHVARWDYLANLFYEVTCIPLWFHPALTLIMRRLRQTRELCCDEVVAAKLLKPDMYARSLVRLIAATPSKIFATPTTIGITDTDNLEKRIMSLLRQQKITATRKTLAVIAACLLLIAPCVIGTKLALAFEIAAPASGSSSEEQFAHTPFGREQLQIREEMKSLEHTLQEQIQTTPEPKRAEIEKRLLEVQLNLIAHEQTINRYSQQQPREEEMQRLRELFAQIETKYPGDEKLLREARQKLAEVEKLYAESRPGSNDAQINRRPRLISGAQPAYTDDARAKGITGGVLLTVTVARDGTVQDVALKRGLFPSLDESALQAARKLRFEPALQNGEAVSQTVTVEFFFSAQTNSANVDQVDDGNWVNADRELRRRKQEETVAQDDKARRQAELTDAAVITMDRAVQIATSKYPGKVLACSLGRDKEGPVFYHMVIVSTEGDKTTTRYVWLSAIDGTILRAEDQPRSAISGGVLNGKAISLPNPEYPAIARAAHASGTVEVQIVVDEQGNVISANAISGHPLLQGASVRAARQAKFAPTMLNGQPVKVSGVLTYNFVVQ